MCHPNFSIHTLVITLLSLTLTIICHCNQFAPPTFPTKQRPSPPKSPRVIKTPQASTGPLARFDDWSTGNSRLFSAGELCSTFARWNSVIKESPAAVSDFISTAATQARPRTSPSAPACYSAKRTTSSTKNGRPTARPTASVLLSSKTPTTISLKTVTTLLSATATAQATTTIARKTKTLLTRESKP
jgi:hypothetical protein